MQIYLIIWPNLQSSDHPSHHLRLYPKFAEICVCKAAVSVEDLNIKTTQKLASFLVPPACVTASCLPQLLEHQVQQIFLCHNRERFNSATGQLSAWAQTCVISSH